MLKKKSMFIGGIWHETNTFSNKKTFIKDFKSYQWIENKNLIKKSLHTNTEIGGFLDVLNQKNLNVIPSLFAAAVPSGIVTKNTFLKIVKKIIHYLNKNEIDGVLLALHGALVVEDVVLPEHFLIAEIKQKLNKNIPVVATFDLHANLSLELFKITDVLIGYDTFPHIDMRARGREAALQLCEMIKNRKKPKKYFKKLPILTVPQMQSTNESPMKEIMKSVFISEKKNDVFSISVVPGFPYSDIKDLGLTVIGYGSNLNVIREECEEISNLIKAYKKKFTPKILTLQNLQTKLLNFKNLKKPIIITDPSDNVGGGALGNNTEILEILLKYKLSGTILIWAPYLREKNYKGNLFNDFINPYNTYYDNKSLKINGNIIFKATNFSYERDGLYMTGQKVKMGNVLVIKTKFNLKVILTENRVMPFDDKHIKVFGIDPKQEDIIVTKSGSAWKIAFGEIAKTVLNVDTEGICSSNVKNFRYSNNNVKKYWPLNE
jgi:microcystin degradation protein MlrC